MKKAIFILFIATLLSGIAFAGNFLFGGKTEKEPSYEAVIAKKKNIGSSILATGTVKPIIGAEVKVGARISGKVEHLYANIGDKVDKDQVIAEIEKMDLEAQVAQSEANLKASEAGIGVSKASFWPALSAESDYGFKVSETCILVKQVEEKLKEHFAITHVILQIEFDSCLIKA